MTRPRSKRYALLLLIAPALAVLVSCTASFLPEDEPPLEVADEPYVWVMNYSHDMQLPELPTGCEATAAATMCRMQGALVTKTQVADALPKSDADFVHAFLGDPYAETGWACSAPAIAETLNGIFEHEEKFAAVELTGDDLWELPLPCAVWVSIECADPGEAVREQEGYGLFRRSHCVVLTRRGEVAVDVVDPLRGVCQYPTERFTEIYDHMGRQAVYVAPLDEAVPLIQERSATDDDL